MDRSRMLELKGLKRKVNVTLVLFVGLVLGHLMSLQSTPRIISPLPESGVYIKTSEFIYPKINTVEEIVTSVFGIHSNKAFKLLSCENRPLDPRAKNVNKSGSIDRGLFQINNKWQEVDNKRFLYDPLINTQMAWRIYEDSGYNFKMWTCGKKLNI